MSTSPQPTAATDAAEPARLPRPPAGRGLPPAVTSTSRQAGDWIGRHPGMALALAAGVGVAVGWLVKRT